MSGRVKPIRVIVADDHPIVRAGFREALKELPGVEVVGEAGDGHEALELVRKHHPDVVFMDISMPGLNGLEATERIIKMFPTVRVIVVSRHDNEEYYWRALRAGASGYLLKLSAIIELKVALQRVVDGEIYLCREIAARLRDHLPLDEIARARRPVEQLSERQREILQLIAEGQTTKEIALTLKLSAKTVEYHRMQLMQRLNIFDIPGLVHFAVRTGLIVQESQTPTVQPSREATGTGGPVVFFSYATPNLTKAEEVCRWLEAEGLPSWMAPRNPEPGSSYNEAISKALSASKVIVLILSADSFKSDHVRREVRFAIEEKKIVIPFKIEAVEMPAELRYLLAGIQFIDATTGSASQHRDSLVNAVWKRLSELGVPERSNG